jgi:hypothetical protein
MRLIAFLFILLTLVPSCAKDAKYYLRQGKPELKEFSVSFPFEFTYELLLVEARINGEDVRLILDTGAPNVITSDLKQKLGLEPVTKVVTTDSGEKSGIAEYVSLDTVNVNGLNVFNSTALVIDLNDFHVFRCLDIDGLLGANFFRYGALQIDYEKKLCHYADDSDDLPYDLGYLSFPFEPNRAGTPKAKIKFRNRIFTDVTIDSGSAGYFSLKAYPSNSLKEKKEVVTLFGTTSYGAFGANIDTSYYLRGDLDMNGLVFNNEIINLKRKNSNTVGNEVFQNYIVSIDWNKNKVFLSPNPTKDVKFESFGFGIVWENDSVFVSNIIFDSDL